MKTSTAVFSILFVVMALATGCENELDETPNVLPSNDMMVVDAAPPPPDGGATCTDCVAVGTWYRFNKLTVDSLDGEQHPVISILNPAWDRDVQGFELNILFEVTAIDEGSVTLRAINGARVGEDEICTIPATAVELAMIFGTDDGPCHLASAEAASINIYAGTPEFTKNCAPNRAVPNSIPVEQVRLTAELSPDCTRILGGKVLEAGIPADAMDEVCTCAAGLAGSADACGALDPEHMNMDGSCLGCNAQYQSLGQLVSMFGELNKGCLTADGDPAICLEASFEAVQLEASPPECP